LLTETIPLSHAASSRVWNFRVLEFVDHGLLTYDYIVYMYLFL
jgi:hypothetical protein